MKVALQRLETATILQANDEIVRHRFADGHLRLQRLLGRFGFLLPREKPERIVHRSDQGWQFARRYGIMLDVGRNDLGGHLHPAEGCFDISHLKTRIVILLN